ncbi:MAG: flavin reductase [Anaerolineales bacterium]|nr:flavin reductase [Anaerolineales bacterium]
MPTDPDTLRAVMRHWPTGVTILTSRSHDYAHGMTVNSFASVALDPPLVLASIENNVRTHALILHSGCFALSFLREGQEWISDRFAGRDTENTDRFEGLALYSTVTGAPILAENIGHLDCRVVASHPAGNHTIFIGEVVDAGVGTVGPVFGDDDTPADTGERPLIYYNRGYRRLA